MTDFLRCSVCGSLRVSGSETFKDGCLVCGPDVEKPIFNPGTETFKN